jgi:RNA polymerase sigma-70 factor, ECF subfamily
VIAEATEVPRTDDSCTDWSDSELVQAISEGREEAFGELFRRHSRSVSAACRMILGSRPECDDIVSEVFVKIWLSPEAFDPARGSLLTYLRVNARGRSIDLVRSETARIRREKNDGWVSAAAAEEDSDLWAAETAEQIRRALASLPANEREPIELAYFKGMTYRQVALHLDVPEGTVKSRIRGGFTRLRLSDHLQGQLEDR